MKTVTYSINNAFHKSSDLLKAYKNLHVVPKKRNKYESRYSKNIAKTSSGNVRNDPIQFLETVVAVYWFPAGFKPRG